MTDRKQRFSFSTSQTANSRRDSLPRIAAGLIPMKTGEMAINIARRKFILTLGSATLSWPLAARAQKKLPIIGFLGSATAPAWNHWITVFVQQMHGLGWIEGRTIAIEYRWAEGSAEREVEFAAEFVRLKVDVIVAPATPAALAAKQATAAIPIVFVVAGEPVQTGLVLSLARPGGNVTGLTTLAAGLAAKRLELFRDLVASLHLLAVLIDAGNPASVLEMTEVQAAARPLGIETVTAQVRSGEEISSAFEDFKGHAQALYVAVDPLMGSNRVLISNLAFAAGLPTMYGNRDYLETGGLLSYGPNFTELFRRAAYHVDKILRGTKPADIPVEQPTKFDLAINLKTARELGIEVPPSLLAIADEVIE
jgi:putative tryptophan/tyrosine transport system substrate-binding protein